MTRQIGRNEFLYDDHGVDECSRIHGQASGSGEVQLRLRDKHANEAILASVMDRYRQEKLKTWSERFDARSDFAGNSMK